MQDLYHQQYDMLHPNNPILFVDAPRLLGASWGFVTGDINKVSIVTTD